MRTSRLLGTLCAAALLACAAAGCGKRGAIAAQPAARPQPESRFGSVQLNEPAHDFTLTTLKGERIKLSDLKGKPVLVNFWATWCPPCNSELPTLETAYRKHHPQGLEILGIAVNDTESALTEKAKEKGLTYPIGLGEAASRAYGVTAIPTSVFVDREGKVASVVAGAVSSEQLETELSKILQGGASAPPAPPAGPRRERGR